ncbi:hypothetical protein CKM354_001193300 [Cercospora kikuchii]|uniref:Uncharacterized protein n=1 Tax=Cercospora kikuchii TaxID=84275 RepID=A0A9P3CXT7_9PEZI|nr:uncharacterized protein CKM354_001193300 [Cercospora kikuchii]GIZ48890.1 hypothetical protein CKM354_001193300 [Cercospora kikuchii]
MNDPFSNKLPIIHLETPQSFHTKCKNLLTSLHPDDLLIITTESEALQLFTTSDHPLVLCTDHSLALPKYSSLLKKAAVWVSMGGEIMFTGQFASLASPEQINTLFSAFSIPWRAGDVIEGEFDVNEEIKGIWWKPVEYRYRQRARCLKNVRDGEAMYRPCPWVEEVDLSQAAVAVRWFWDGKVGYVGDLDDREESSKALRGIMANA